MRKCTLALVAWLLAARLAAQNEGEKRFPYLQERRGSWLVGAEIGDGQLHLASDQFHGNRNATLGFGILGLHSLTERVRIGAEFMGWGKPTDAPEIRPGRVVKGVGNAFGVVDVFPSGGVPVFVRAGAGFAEYYTSNPFDPDSRGWSWTAGAGYVIPIIDVWDLRLVPMVDYAAGRLGDVDNLTTPQIGQRYSRWSNSRLPSSGASLGADTDSGETLTASPSAGGVGRTGVGRLT
jgi:hypothetical protein